MDALMKEIERKRKAHAAVRPASGGKKYFRRGDLEANRAAAYNKQEEVAADAVRDKSAVSAAEVAARYLPSKKPTAPAADDAGGAAAAAAGGELMSPGGTSTSSPRTVVPAHLSVEEVKRRLRAIGEVVTFFGEDAKKREARLRKVLTTLGEEGTEGRLNVVGELTKQMEKEKAEIGGGVFVMQETEDEAKKKALDAKKMPAPVLNRRMSTEDSIASFIDMLCVEYQRALDSRDADVAKTAAGNKDTVYFKECHLNIQPLLKMLKRKLLEKDIVDNLSLIMHKMIMRDYVKAMEQYVVLTIGNAPWPMGVTSVGIHERAGRERIFEQNQAHILNDDLKRKYIHAFKRLMIFCQYRYPTDPSKMFEPGGVRNTTLFTDAGMQAKLAAEYDDAITGRIREHQKGSLQAATNLWITKTPHPHAAAFDKGRDSGWGSLSGDR